MKSWQFEALDSLFFRGANPFNHSEGGFLDSQFPPTAQTLAGVIRAAIGDAKGVDWGAFRDGKQPEVAALIGKESDDHGKLSFTGPYIYKDGKRLYPVPLCMLYSEKEQGWGQLQPSKTPLKTDMGDKCLPEVVEPKVEGAKPLENAWLNEENLQKVLAGDKPSGFFNENDLFEAESRTGIARNNKTRQTEEGALYFTRHIRLKDGVRIGMYVDGADDVTPASMVRLGGEGRMAHLKVEDVAGSSLHRHDESSNQAMIVLLTHGDFEGKSEPPLPEGVDIASACIGKAVREGGWDYKKRKPKPLKSLVPAGSVYFVKGDMQKLKKSIGKRTEFGYGEIALGTWEEQS